MIFLVLVDFLYQNLKKGLSLNNVLCMKICSLAWQSADTALPTVLKQFPIIHVTIPNGLTVIIIWLSYAITVLQYNNGAAVAQWSVR